MLQAAWPALQSCASQRCFAAAAWHARPSLSLNCPPPPPAQPCAGDDLAGLAGSTDGSNRTLTVLQQLRLHLSDQAVPSFACQSACGTDLLAVRLAGSQHTTAESSACTPSPCSFARRGTWIPDSDFARNLDSVLHPSVDQCSRQSLTTNAYSTRTWMSSIWLDAAEGMETPQVSMQTHDQGSGCGSD